ncbi:hypothetical protein DPMN_012067 [Dreissena polymorpha]|uniref:Uncharacterized protein n=1 Tax=Dreissena polymorpha TaxID=45954 RepID=A0A9D4S2E5_DREPO|nr:hypothetical protein DPMN_012067 [Dreissena polymorpha]
MASEHVVSSEHVAGSGTFVPEYEDEVEVPYQMQPLRAQVCASDDEQDYSNLNKGFSDALFGSDNNNRVRTGLEKCLKTSPRLEKPLNKGWP